MRRTTLILLAAAALAAFPLQAMASTIDLGTAGNFAVLGGSTVTNTGTSAISGNGGDVGLYPGTSITGFASSGANSVSGTFTQHITDSVALQAQSDLTTAYNAAASQAVTQTLSGQDLGNMTLTAGVYFFSSSAQLTGQLTLDSQGNPDAQFVFQIGSTLTTASNASVIWINGSSCHVFWQVGTSATLGTGTAFEGHILAAASITMNTGATLNGSALAGAAVTLDTNSITNSVCTTTGGGDVSAVPLPTSASMGLGLLALAGLACVLRRRPRS